MKKHLEYLTEADDAFKKKITTMAEKAGVSLPYKSLKAKWVRAEKNALKTRKKSDSRFWGLVTHIFQGDLKKKDE